MKTTIDRAEIAQVIWKLQNTVSAGALAAAADEAVTLIEALATAPALLAQTNHAATCIYCGEAVIYDTRAEADMQAAHQRLVDHDQHCPRNPLVARVTELQAQVKRLGELLDRSMTGLEWYRESHPRSWSEADDEHLEECRIALAQPAISEVES